MYYVDFIWNEFKFLEFKTFEFIFFEFFSILFLNREGSKSVIIFSQPLLETNIFNTILLLILTHQRK